MIWAGTAVASSSGLSARRIDRVGGHDQPDVAEGLREVAE